MKKLIMTMILAALSVNAYSCQFSTDCEIGSQCIKASGEIYGACIGGSSPGNDNDRAPVSYSNDISGKKGDTCSFNTDCGVGDRCVKSGGLDGTCM